MAWKQPQLKLYRKSVENSKRYSCRKSAVICQITCGYDKKVWVIEIAAEDCQTVIHSMPQQLQEATKNKGGHTKY